MILVDTSVLIDFLKGNENKKVEILKAIINEQIPFAITSIIYQEILQGAANAREFKLLHRYLSTQRFLQPLNAIDTYHEAALIYFNARKKGITIRSTIDCLIAQIAIENDASLLHNDKDFDRIAEISALRCIDI
ncbi:MAG: PIN domain nuclease [Bacteroidetes bacterium]|nr:MAG: PIN domain nuclease [Bacteroidota bacterium]